MNQSRSALAVWLLTLPIVAGIAGCNGSNRVILESAAPYPTSIEYDRLRDRLLVSSYADGSVTEVGMDPDHKFRILLDPHSNGIERGIRIRFDAARNRLWLLERGEIHVYQFDTNQFVQKIKLQGLNDRLNNCLPDMALDAAGAAIISSNIVTTLWRIDPDSFQVTEHPLKRDADHDKDFGFSSLVYRARDGILFAANATMGTLWRIDVNAGSASSIELTTPIRGACALALEDDQGEQLPWQNGMFVAGGFRGGLLHVRLSPDMKHGYVTRIAAGNLAIAPTGIALVNHMLYLTSSQLPNHPDYSKDDGLPVSTKIIRIRMP